MFFYFWGVFVLVLPLFLVLFSWRGVISCVVCVSLAVADEFLMVCSGLSFFARRS